MNKSLLVPVLLFLLLTGLRPNLYSQNVPVTFRVNMSYLVSTGKFDPSKEYVDLAGSFNGWGAPVAKLADSDGDKTYEIILNGFTPGSAIEFKFRINGQWNGREEFPNGGPNRRYVVKPDSNVVSLWYNNETSPDGPPKADFTANSQTLFENGMVYFEDHSSGIVTGWQWSFEGGTPSESKLKNPSVYYPLAGSFDVRLIVSGSNGIDTLFYNDFIKVNKRVKNKTSWWNNTVFYEMFVRSFYDSDGNGIGDFKGITQKLDYLNDGNPDTHNDLGITGIWLMPINPSPSYHGYDVTNYRDVNVAYGTMNDFKELLNEAHRRGIKVIIDFVMNHSSNQHKWFQQSAQNNPLYRNFYRWSPVDSGSAWYPNSSGYYYSVFGSGMPDLNYEEPTLKDSMFSAADFWLKDVGVDGFRLDAVLYILESGTQTQNTAETIKFWGEFDQHIKQTKPDCFAVGEAWTSTETVVNYVNNDRLDYCFEFDLASSILGAVNSGNAGPLAAQIQKVCNLYPFLQYGTFLTNHDQNRVMSTLQNNIDKAKAAASLYLTFPGIPYLYYGEEIGMTGSKPDQYIRTPMQWSDKSNAGFSTVNPWIALNSNYSSYNVAGELADSGSILNWYKKLIAIRNQETALRLGDYEGLTSSASSVMAFMRHYEDKSVLVIVNTGAAAQGNLTLSMHGSIVKPGNYKVTDLLSGTNSSSITVNNSFEIKNVSVTGYGTSIYSFSNGSGTEVEESRQTEKYFRLGQNYPNPFNPVTSIQYSIARQSPVELKVFDMLGRGLTTLVNEVQDAGEYKIRFDASSLPSGMYIYTIKAGAFRDSRKLLLLK